MNTIELVTKNNPDVVIGYACGKCHIYYHNKEMAEQCCDSICPECKVNEKERYYTVCDECRDKHNKERARLVFEKATKIKWKDYEGKFVYVNDEYIDVDYLEEYLFEQDVEPENLPKFVNACFERAFPISKNCFIDFVEDRLADESYEDATYDYSTPKEFLDGIDKFIESNKEMVSYECDDKTVIDISSLIEEIKKETNEETKSTSNSLSDSATPTVEEGIQA